MRPQRVLDTRELSKPRDFRARWAEEHRDWHAAGRVETDGYVVISNIGYDVLHRSASALEQIAEF